MIEVRYEHLLPAEFEARRAAVPVVYLPLGSIEWHSHHLPYGVDTQKASALCERAARSYGGIVAPATPWGAMHGNWRGATHPGLRPETLRAMARDIVEGFAIVGFKVMMVVSGHWTSRQTVPYRAAIDEVGDRLGIRGFVTFDGSDEYDGFDIEEGLGMDHAGALETSLYAALHPERVHLERLMETDRSDLPGVSCERTASGIHGADPVMGIDVEQGGRHADRVVELLGARALALLGNGESTMEGR